MVDPGPGSSWLPPHQVSALHKVWIEAHLVFLIGSCFWGKASRLIGFGKWCDDVFRWPFWTSCSPKAPRASYGGSTIHPACPILGNESWSIMVQDFFHPYDLVQVSKTTGNFPFQADGLSIEPWLWKEIFALHDFQYTSPLPSFPKQLPLICPRFKFIRQATFLLQQLQPQQFKKTRRSCVSIITNLISSPISSHHPRFKQCFFEVLLIHALHLVPLVTSWLHGNLRDTCKSLLGRANTHIILPFGDQQKEKLISPNTCATKNYRLSVLCKQPG